VETQATEQRLGGWSDLVVLPLAFVVDLMVWGGKDRQLRDGTTLPLWVIPVCTAVVFAALLLRRRFPLAVFTAQICYATAGAVMVPEYASVAGVLVGLHAVASRRNPTVSLFALLACVAPVVLPAHDTAHVVRGDRLLTFVAIVTLSTLAAGAAWGLGYRTWVADRNTAALEAQRDAAVAEAQRRERLRLARELHDILAHSVSVMVLQAAGGQAMLSSHPDQARDAFNAIHDAGVGCMGELRRLLSLLRAAGEDFTGGLGQVSDFADLEELVQTSCAAGVAVSKDVEGEPGWLDSSVGLTVYRIVQESLTNTMKHAGVGATAHVRLVWQPAYLTVTVEDRASTRRTPVSHTGGLSTHHGLVGLRERVAIVGGTFEAHPVSGGFVVRATLPLKQDPTREPAADSGCV
jgi:signal transduction histidine kinase